MARRYRLRPIGDHSGERAQEFDTLEELASATFDGGGSAEGGITMAKAVTGDGIECELNEAEDEVLEGLADEHGVEDADAPLDIDLRDFERGE